MEMRLRELTWQNQTRTQPFTYFPPQKYIIICSALQGNQQLESDNQNECVQFRETVNLKVFQPYQRTEVRVHVLIDESLVLTHWWVYFNKNKIVCR